MGLRRIATTTATTVGIALGVLLGTVAVAPVAPAAPSDTSTTAAAAQAPAAERGAMRNTQRPRVTGAVKFGRTLRATQGRWSFVPDQVRYQWFRGKQPIRGARSQRYGVRPEDVGRRLSVRVMGRHFGKGRAWSRSRWTAETAHRVPVRRTVTYHVETRGKIRTSVQQFRRQAQETFADPRGWRGMGVRFVPVRRGGAFTLVLAEANQVPRFSSGCSAQWSCRVGRFVIINQSRWRGASPAWNAANGPLRGYRHMVVNHETGHWLGRGHASCPGRGRLAPVMMTQSKGLGGCRFNPWPTLGELR